MGIFNLFKAKTNSKEIGKIISWYDSINMIFRIINFDDNGTKIDLNGIVKAKSLFKPYGYLAVTNPNSSEVYQLPIIHKDDYLLIEQFFTDPKFKKTVDENEILVVYRPKNIHASGLAGFDRCLHYVITPRGTIESFYDKYGLFPDEKIIEKLFVKFSWGMIQVEINKNPLD
jgi:hypothetical protein